MTVAIDLEKRVALVTGGARGVGRGITAVLRDAGARVVIAGRTPPDDLPEGVEFLPADVRDPDAVATLIDAIVDRHGRLDVAVNNAGGAPYALAADASPRLHAGVIDLNLTAALHVAQAANRVMQRQDGGGSIVNISSVSAQRSSPGTAAYGAAKAGLDSLTRTLAVEWAPRVRVNGITVGPVRTELSALHYGDEDGIAAVARTIALGRLAEPEDVGRCCAFLASDQAAYVSGALLRLDGGGERPAFLDAASVNRPDDAEPTNDQEQDA